MASTSSNLEPEKLTALLQEAGASMRFEGETLWRAQEIFAVLVVTLLSASAAIAATTFVNERAVSGALAIVAFVSASFALIGHYVADWESFYFARNRLVRDKLLMASAVPSWTGDPLAESKKLSLSIESLSEFGPSDIQDLGDQMFTTRGVRWAFRWGFFLLFALASLTMAAFVGLAVSEGNPWVFVGYPRVSPDPRVFLGWLAVGLLAYFSIRVFWGRSGLRRRFESAGWKPEVNRETELAKGQSVSGMSDDTHRSEGEGGSPKGGMAASKLDVGLELSKRLLDNQLDSVNQLQTKVGVLLGFDATALGVIFSVSRSWIADHPIFGGVVGFMLTLAAVIFAIALWTSDYLEAPNPNSLVTKLNDSRVRVEDLVDWGIGNLLGAFLTNSNLIRSRFRFVNAGIIFMLLGLAVFVGCVVS